MVEIRVDSFDGRVDAAELGHIFIGVVVFVFEEELGSEVLLLLVLGP
jgi:hypothetical protein